MVMYSSDIQAGQPTVVVAAFSALRCAQLASLLRNWAKGNRVSVTAISTGEIREAIPSGVRIVLGVLGTGAASLRDPALLDRLKGFAAAITGAPAVVVSDLDEPSEMAAAVRAGARGFVPASTEPKVALAALSFILEGGSYFPRAALLGGMPVASSRSTCLPLSLPLTPRQRAVLVHVRAGMSNKAIARLLGVEQSTVKDHVKVIMRKLGASNRTQAAFATGGVVPAGALPTFPVHE